MGGIRERNLSHTHSNFFREHPDGVASTEELSTYLDRYAVRWVVLQSGRPFPAPFGDLLQIRAKVPDGVICETMKAPSFFQEGSGRVRASMNRVEVSGSESGVPLVLRYHFLETLVCEPGCRVTVQSVQGDPVGFIRIPGPHPADLVIRNAY